MVAILHDGNGGIITDGSTSTSASNGWKAHDATAAFAPDFGPNPKWPHGAGTGSYDQPHENIDSRLYPAQWRTAAYDDTGWSGAAVVESTYADGIAAKEALPITLRAIPAASFHILQVMPDIRSGGLVYTYVIDFGKNFQGHVNISFATGTAGQQVSVHLGEQLNPDGTVPTCAESGNHWVDVWTLSGSGSAADNFVPHEYAEFRWAMVTGQHFVVFVCWHQDTGTFPACTRFAFV
jgi:hypothetical protein